MDSLIPTFGEMGYLNQEEYSKIWEELLRRRGFGSFEQFQSQKKSYLRTNYRINEPNGNQRTETWIINSKGSISPVDILTYYGVIQKLGFDFGVFLTQSTLTSSAAQVLKESAPSVRVYDHVTFVDLIGQEPDIARKYGIPIEETLTKESKSFLQRMKECPSGKETWREYQDLIGEIFEYLFVPPLAKAEPQSRAEDGLDIRDLVFPNHAETRFWLEVKSDYKGSYVVVEAKNKEDLGKNDVVQLGNYLNEKQLGLFGIISCRKIDGPAIDERKVAYSHPPYRMIVLVEDKDIAEMLVKKSRKEAPDDVLRDRIDLYRMKYR